MNKLLLVAGLFSLMNKSIAGTCKNYLLHVSLPTGSQTLVHGCDSQNIPYRAIMIKYYYKRDMLKSAQVMVDSRDTLNRVRAEAALAKMEDGQQSNEFNLALRKQVFSKLKLALDAPSEEEQINHVNAATENLKDLLVE